MDKLFRFRYCRILVVALILLLFPGNVLSAAGPPDHFAGNRQPASAKEERSFSPVYESEKRLTEAINHKRVAVRARPLDPDWDLFRFARMEAEQLANGQIVHVDANTLTKLMTRLGRSDVHIRALIIRGGAAREWSDSDLGASDKMQRLIASDGYRLIGAGYAEGKHKRFWVILYA